jgi:AcrR family transcriptional regulator
MKYCVVMVVEPGLRERKKQRTRRALIEAAARLFEERGYAETTVAEIAAAVEVSPRTFFSYFPSKEDVLFADTEARVRIAVDSIATRAPADRIPDVLLRAIGQVLASEAFTADLGGRSGPVRLALISSAPALQAAALRRLLQAQEQLADALRQAYPEELDQGSAAAVVGALVGAAVAAVVASLRRGDGLEGTQAEFQRAVEVAVRGIAAPIPRR